MPSRPHRSSCLRLATISLLFASAFPVPLQAQGVVVAWGNDDFGQVLDVPIGADLTQVSGGHAYALALRSDGSIEAWGNTDGGSVDYGQVTNAPTGTGFVQISAASFSALALRQDGSIVGWGRDSYGQISGIPTGTGFTQVSMGGRIAGALRSDGSVVSWGSDDYGAVSGSPPGTGFVQVSAGDSHLAALRSNGSVVVWGDPSAWIGFPFGDTYTQVEASSFVTVGVRTNGTLTIGGFDGDGDGATDDPLSYLPLGSNFVQVSFDLFHGVALRSNGQIVSWGVNVGGVVGLTPDGFNFNFVAAGAGFSLALDSQNAGTRFCSGSSGLDNCPCGQHGFLIGGGCANTNPQGGADIKATGSAFLSNDTFQLEVVGAPANKLGLILRGENALNGGAGIPLGDGLLCVAGQSARSQVQLTSGAGTVVFQGVQGGTFGAWSYGPGVATYYQFWFRDPGNTCSGQGFNFSNAWKATWLP